MPPRSSLSGVRSATALELLTASAGTRRVTPDLGHTLTPDNVFLICTAKSPEAVIEHLLNVCGAVPPMARRRVAREPIGEIDYGREYYAASNPGPGHR